jgi:hypothetical protein
MKRADNRHWIFWGWFVLSSVIFCWALLGPYGDQFRNLAVRIGLLSVFAGISLLILRRTWQISSLWPSLFACLIGYAVIYQIATYLPGINNYPFTLTWSEGSAYYFASAYFSDQLYGVKVALPLINPTRHLLLAAPFLIQDLPILIHRAWEVVLWLGITSFTIILVERRLTITNRLLRYAYFGWVFLYLLQGPIYYFLMLSILPVLWGFDAKNLRKTLVLVILGSMWAGASRVNWIPVPALLAITLYLLEVRIDKMNWWRYLRQPLLWLAAGAAAGLLVWFGYAQISGQPAENFGIYFSSDLLWYRLLPNATFPAGVLLSSVLASLPLIGIILLQLYRSGTNYHWIRHLGIAAILLVLYAGGLIVSTKIGGGNNIHNLDAYLFILLVAGSYLYFGKSVPDYDLPNRTFSPKLLNVLIAIAVVIPVIFTLQGGRSISLPDGSRTENALLTIQEFADRAVSNGGKVLFIAERQLLTFDEIENVPLQPEYERMKLMEMVMGGNEEYLAEFHRKIRNQEYALIVSEPLVVRYKGSAEQFGEENDVYVHQVTAPVLCYYEPVKDIFKFPIQLYKPKAEKDTCS